MLFCAPFRPVKTTEHKNLVPELSDYEQGRHRRRLRRGACVAADWLDGAARSAPRRYLWTLCLLQRSFAAPSLRSTLERPIVLLPPMHFGASHHWLAFAGVLSLTADTYIRAVKDLCDCLIVQGFSRILIVNGHGGNDAPNRVVMMDLINDHDVQIETHSYWNLDPQGLSELLPEGFADVPGHSGDFETSMMLSAFPDLVEPDWRELIDRESAAVREAGPPSGMGCIRSRQPASSDGASPTSHTTPRQRWERLFWTFTPAHWRD